MKRLVVISFTCLVVLFIRSGSQSTVSAGSKISVTVSNDSAYANTYELIDNNNGKYGCTNTLPDISLDAHASTSIPLCSSEAQTSPNCCGSFKDRIKGNQTWNNHDLLDEGRKVSL